MDMTQSKRYIEKLKAKYSHKDKSEYYYLSHSELLYLGPGLTMGDLLRTELDQRLQLTLVSPLAELKPQDGHLYRVETFVATVMKIVDGYAHLRVQGKAIGFYGSSSMYATTWTFIPAASNRLENAWLEFGPERMFKGSTGNGEYWIARYINEDRAEAIMYPPVNMLDIYRDTYFKEFEW